MIWALWGFAAVMVGAIGMLVATIGAFLGVSLRDALWLARHPLRTVRYIRSNDPSER